MTLRALTSFNLGQRIVTQGELVADDDPIVVGRARLFAPVGVEQATARPGELRNTPPPPVDPDPIPRKVGDIVAWIGDDPARAARALEVEQATKSPRKGVLAAAQAVLDAASPADGGDGDGEAE